MAPYGYKNTEFQFIIRILRDKTGNLESTEKCPKCSAEIQSYYDLLIHIERFHPHDVKHKPYLKQTPQQEEPTIPTVDNFEMNDENVVTINEEFPVFQTSDSISDSSTLDELKDNPFFKVIVYLCLQFI